MTWRSPNRNTDSKLPQSYDPLKNIAINNRITQNKDTPKYSWSFHGFNEARTTSGIVTHRGTSIHPTVSLTYLEVHHP